MRELHHSLTYVDAVEPAVKTATTKGTGADLQGYSAAECVFSLGAPGDSYSSSVKVTLSVQESDTDVDGDYTDAAAGDLLGTLPVIDADAKCDQVYSVGYIGGKRYIRPVFTFAGTHSTGTAIAALTVKGRARHTGTLV